MSMKLIAIAAMTLGMAGATPSFAQTSATSPATTGAASSDCPVDATANSVDNVNCNKLGGSAQSTTGTVVAPATGGAMSANPAGAMKTDPTGNMATEPANANPDCPAVATANSVDNKDCTGLQQ